MVLDAKSITPEEFYQFNEKYPKYRYIDDKLGEKPLRNTIKHIGKMMQVLNAHATKSITQMPEAKLELPSDNLEAIHCEHCHSYLPIRRHLPAITKSPALSPQCSQYITQPLAYCSCRLSAALVDHRGNLRVYGTTSLVHYIEGHPIHHLISNGTHLAIPRQLLDGKKPQYERIVFPRYLWETNFIDLSYIPENHSNVVLPIPQTTYRQEYLQTYAYNHQVCILSAKYLILPSGYAIPTKSQPLAGLLETYGSTLRGIKRTHSHLQETNRIIEDLNTVISQAMGLPLVTPSYYSHQTIGYLQVARYQRPTPTTHKSKIYLSPFALKTITVARNTARRILRDILNGKSIPNLLQSIAFRPFAKTPSGLIFMTHKPTRINPHIFLGRGSRFNP